MHIGVEALSSTLATLAGSRILSPLISEGGTALDATLFPDAIASFFKSDLDLGGSAGAASSCFSISFADLVGAGASSVAFASSFLAGAVAFFN